MKVGDKVKLREITKKELKASGIDGSHLSNQIVTIQHTNGYGWVDFVEDKNWSYRIEWCTPILNVLVEEGEY